MANSLIDEMRNGNSNAIVAGLLHHGAIYRMNAIAFSSLQRRSNKEIVEKIKALRTDHFGIDGYSVSDFAIAALDILGIEKYTGTNQNIKRLIDCRFNFMA